MGKRGGGGEARAQFAVYHRRRRRKGHCWICGCRLGRLAVRIVMILARVQSRFRAGTRHCTVHTCVQITVGLLLFSPVCLFAAPDRESSPLGRAAPTPSGHNRCTVTPRHTHTKSAQLLAAQPRPCPGRRAGALEQRR